MSEPPGPSAGRVLNERYELVEKLGQGAFGEVFLARDLLFDAMRVVKIVDASDERATRALHLEVKAAARIESPHIARTYDSGQDDSRAWVVREFVEGDTLDTILRVRGSMPVDKALSVAAQIARGLSVAHRQGILHRDLKPSNVIIAEDGQVKLLDLGVAGTLQQDTQLTSVGQVWGTPQYMAPEQFTGEAQSPATDVYGLALLLYEMLTGERLFMSANVIERMGASLSENIVVSHDAIPAEIADFLTACLAREPKSRPHDGAAALADIERLLQSYGADGEISPTFPESIPGGWENPAAPAAASAGAFSLPGGMRDPVFSERRPARSAGRLLLWSVGGVCLAVLGGALLFTTGSLEIELDRLAWFVVGLCLIAVGIGFGLRIGRMMGSETHRASERQAGAVLAGAAGRDELTETIAADIDELIASVTRSDQSIMARTIALMVHEYREAEDSRDRQEALLKAVDLLGRLTDRMTPWYVRYQSFLAFLVSAIGVISGVISIHQALAG